MRPFLLLSLIAALFDRFGFLQDASCAAARHRRPCDRVHVLQMAPQIAALSKELFANIALVGPLHRVLAKVVPQITALAEDSLAAFESAPKVQFGSLGFAVIDLDRLVPLLGDTLKLLGIRRLSVHIGRTFARYATILLLLATRGA